MLYFFRSQNVLYFFEERERFLPPVQDKTATEGSQVEIHAPSSFPTFISAPHGKGLGHHRKTEEETTTTTTTTTVLHGEEDRRDLASQEMIPDAIVTMAKPLRTSTSGDVDSVDSQSEKGSWQSSSVSVVSTSTIANSDEASTPANNEDLTGEQIRTFSVQQTEVSKKIFRPSEFQSEASVTQFHQFEETPDDVADLYRPKRQLTKWTRENFPKYWVSRLQSLSDPVLNDLFGKKDKDTDDWIGDSAVATEPQPSGRPSARSTRRPSGGAENTGFSQSRSRSRSRKAEFESGFDKFNVDNFVQAMQLTDMEEIQEEYKKGDADDNSGYDSDRSGITALPAAKAMGELLGGPGVSVGEALETAGVDASDIGLEAEDFSHRDRSLPPSRYSDPDLQRLLLISKGNNEQYAETRSPRSNSAQGPGGRLEPGGVGAVEGAQGLLKRRSRSYNELPRAAEERQHTDPLLQRRQSAMVGGFGAEPPGTPRDQWEESEKTTIGRKLTVKFRGLLSRGKRSEVRGGAVDAQAEKLSPPVESPEGIQERKSVDPEFERDLPAALAALAEEPRSEAPGLEEHLQKRAAGKIRTVQRHKPIAAGEEVVKTVLRRRSSSVKAPITPFVSGRSRIQKSWNMTCDPNPHVLYKKLVYWAIAQGCARPRNPFIIKVLAGMLCHV